MLIGCSEKQETVLPYKEELRKLGYYSTEKGIECDANICEVKWVGYRGMLECYLLNLCLSALECNKLLNNKKDFALVRVSLDKIVNLSNYSEYIIKYGTDDKDNLYYSVGGLIYSCLPKIIGDTKWKYLYFIYANKKIIVPPYVWRNNLSTDVYNIGLCIEE